MPRRPLSHRLVLALAPSLIAAAVVGGCTRDEAGGPAAGREATTAKPADKASAAKQAEPAPSPEPDPSPTDPASVADAPAADPAGPTAPLQFAAAKIMPADKPELAVTLDADGKVGLGGKPAAMTISPDGKVQGADGKTIAELGPGSALVIGGRSSGITLTDTGLTLSAPDGRKVTMVFNLETHDVDMDPPPGPGMRMRFEGCEAPVTRTCGLVLALYLLAASPG